MAFDFGRVENDVKVVQTEADLSTYNVILYTDGACDPNPGSGGWAFILRSNTTGKILEDCDGLPDTTNNVMEMTAAIEGLKRLKVKTKICIVSDSRYVVNGLSSWMPRWKKLGWARTVNSRKEVKNVELWKELDQLLQGHEVGVMWVKGHSGHKWNERCDYLAESKAREFNLQNATKAETSTTNKP